MKQTFAIKNRTIGKGCPPYIIAELSANHNGNLTRALETITKAKEMGADAIKIQTYTPDTMTIDSDQEDFKIHGGLWDGYNLYQLYKEAHTPYEWHKALFEHAAKVGITIFSSPFDETAIELLESLDAPAYKIASFELTDLPLIEAVAQTGKPMIMSTGMATLAEISEAVATAKQAGATEIALLHCISAYPAPAEQSNLKTISDLAERFNCVVGLSDHTLGTTVAVASVALGASIIEKHFILDRKDKGPDSEFSLEPEQLKTLCQESKVAHAALGSAGYERKDAEKANATFRRSLYFVKDIAEGEVISPEHIRRIRPGFGLAPKHLNEVLGKKATSAIARGTAVDWKHFATEPGKA